MSSQGRERVTRVEKVRPWVTARKFPLTAVEVGVLILVVLTVFAVLFYYFSYLKPEKANLTALENQLDTQKKTLVQIMNGGGSAPPPNSIKEALESLTLFKEKYLKKRQQGQRELIDDINALSKKHSTRLTSGLEMSLENLGEDEKKNGRNSKKNAEETLNVFPKLNVNFTISGQYENLRSFISELERNKQFLVINTLNFTTVEEAGEGEGGGHRASRREGSGLLLSVNLAAYFQQ